MKIKKRLIFVRHPESEGNILSAGERALFDKPNHGYSLTERGKKQAQIVGEYLSKVLFQEFFQSNFKRTQEGMSIIMEELSPHYACLGASFNLRTDFRLDEKWDGIFHELTSEEIKERYPEQIRLRKRSGPYHYRAPGGENCPDVEQRILSFIDSELLVRSSSLSEHNILIVGHGRWFQIFQKVLNELTVEEFLEHRKVSQENCSVTIYEPFFQYKGLGSLPKTIVPWEGKIVTKNTEYA